MEISLKIASISLIFSLIALVWNIFRDIFIDRIKISLRIFVGAEITDDKGRQKMISAGTTISVQGTEKKIPAEKICFQITNTGRRDVEIDSIKAEYINKGSWYLSINEKRYLKPYESTNANTKNTELKENLKNQKIVRIYVEDTKGKKWQFSNHDIKLTSSSLSEI